MKNNEADWDRALRVATDSVETLHRVTTRCL